MSDMYYWEKLTSSKLRFSQKENSKRNALALKNKKVQGIYGKTCILAYLL